MTAEAQSQSSQPTVLPTNIQAARTWGAGGEKYDQVSRGIADAIEHAVDALDPQPGGRISLANWAIGGSVHDMFQLIRSYKPAEKNPAPSPFEWGSSARVLELLDDQFDVQFESGTSFFQPESGAKAWATFSTGFGPVVTLLDAISAEKAEALKAEFIAFHEAHRTGAGLVMRRPYVITKAMRVSEGQRAS